ncbi:cmgc rck mak protein kinase [Moniliophthora roreri MCA 2997]|uniref:Cmgc rck mak protein kinase n=1 Tax=Moniliophthora roreri (strain MCA 2997) TaxID=1381753 RepID=V2WYL4_MONRO|nr:cmgc rck mak protein kinase [Moniliophthora roreri MCA 2997]
MYDNPSNVQNAHNITLPNYQHQQPQQNGQHPPHNSQRPSQQPQAPKSPITVVGIPSVCIENNRLAVGSSQSSSTRSYTPLKVLGDGSFGTVWLCDWHGTLPPNTPLSPMQCGAGARPEWAGKRLVAVKRMKKKWEGGWDECQKLKELESLRAIPFHPNIIPLYDFFLMPATKELYFVFESMEGNLYHLIKARKGRSFTGGLVASIFFQIVSGLDHIHSHGYFHRDMKPENVLVTTTGLFDYTSLSPVAPPNAPLEKDVVAIIKLADFGLARETKSKPPYTQYVSTRWYRAPEVLLLSNDYSNPVDMWALGTIMAEVVNLRPLFPGSDQLDQVARICEILGNPSNEYGLDASKAPLGGGPWPRGIKMAQVQGFEFRRMPPRDIHTLFDRSVPPSLVHCIRDLLKYDPEARLTSRQCLHHQYLIESLPRNNIPLPSGIKISTNFPYVQNGNGASLPSPSGTLGSLSPRSIPPSHSNSIPQPHSLHPSQIPNAASTHRSAFYPHNHPPNVPSPSQYQGHSPTEGPRAGPSWQNHVGDYPMDISPQAEEDYSMPNGQPMDIYPSRPQHVEPDPTLVDPSESGHSGSNKLGKLSGLKKKWVGGMFGGDKSHHQELPPLHENPVASTSTGSLKRTQSAGSDNRSLKDSPMRTDDAKRNKKEAERVQREAEKQRRALAEKMQREQARAVMQKRNKIMQKTENIEWRGGSEQPRLDNEPSSHAKGKQVATGPVRRDRSLHPDSSIVGSTVGAASGRYGPHPGDSPVGATERRSGERMTKVRRMEFDDDHSVSSSDVHSTGRMSSLSFATIDSDPGPSRIRNRPSLFGLNRMTSTSSLRTSFDDFSPSARSSNSFSLDGQLAHDFRTQASMTSGQSPLPGSVSPPPMQMLSLSPSLSPPISPSPQWMQVPQRTETLSSRRGQAPPSISVPQLSITSTRSASYSPYEHPREPNGRPTSHGHFNKSEINPIFKVPPLPTPTSAGADETFSPTSLPPFSQLEAVAGHGGGVYDYPPLSPMSFTAHSEDASSS